MSSKYNLDGNIETMTRQQWESEIIKILHERFHYPSNLLLSPDILNMWELGTTVREGVHAYKTFAMRWFIK